MKTNLHDAFISPAKVLLRTDTHKSVAIGDCHMCDGNFKPTPRDSSMTATLSK
jgi:hypothetical protein